jgi:glycosyltransferase involved in cell wall biosynthesis
VIYNGFPLAGQRGTGPCTTEKRRGCFVILNVARFAPQKGQTFLLDAMARLAPRHPQVELWLAGIGAPESDLRAQAAAAGIADRVRFLGFQEDVTALHALADIFVFPSVFEGFGNALAEAMLAGLPIVASDLPVVRHDVLGDVPAAVLVPPGDSRALADALEILVVDRDARAALGLAARVAAERFRVSSMLDGFRGVYAALTGSNRAAA